MSITIAAAVKKLESTRDKKGSHAGIGPDGSYVLYRKKESVIQKRKETVAKANKRKQRLESNVAKHISRGYKHSDDTDEPFKRGKLMLRRKRTAAEIKEAAGRRNKANAKTLAEKRAEKAKADAEKAKAEKVKAAANRRKARGKAINKAVSGERRLSF
jgi:hypothetical protein